MVSVILFIVGAVVTLWLILPTKSDVINTSEMDALRIMSIGIMTIWTALVLIYLAINLRHIRSESGFYEVPILLSTLLPIMIGLLSYLKPSIFLRRRYREETPPNTKSWLRIRELVKSVSAGLQIKEPRIKCSKLITVPLVYGTSPRNCTLLLPYGFPSIVDSVVLGITGDSRKREAKRCLEHYVVAHELSHIMHRDITVKSIMEITIRFAKYLIAPIILGNIVLLGLRGSRANGGQVSSGFFLLFVFTILYFVFYACYRMTSRHGEYLADARARLMLYGLRSLYSDEDEHGDFIENLLIRMAHEPITTDRRTRRKSSWSFGRTSHPPVRERGKAIEKSTYLSESRLMLRNPSALLIGIWNATILAMGGLCLDLLGVLHMSERVFDISYLLIASAPIYSAFIFLLPVRNATGQSGHDSARFIKDLFRKFLLAVLAYTLTWFLFCTFWVIYALITKPSLTDFVRERIGIIAVFLQSSYWYFGAFALALLLSTVMAESDLDSRRFSTRLNLIFAASFASVILLVVLLLTFPALARARTLGIFISVLLGSICLSSLFGVKIFTSDNIYVFKIHDYPIVNIDCLRSGLSNKVASSVIGALSSTFLFVIPMFIVFLPLKGCIGVDNYQTVIIVIVISAVPITAKLARQQSRKRALTPLYYRICVHKELFGHIDEDGQLFSVASELLEDLRGKDGGYSQQKFVAPAFSYIPSTEATGMVLLVLWDMYDSFDQETADWIVRHESKSGGYSAIENVTPELESTFFAIQCLCKAHQPDSIEYLDRHVGFVTNHQSSSGGFISTGMKNPSLKATYQAIASLNMLDQSRATIENPQKCAEWIFSKWKDTEKNGIFNFEETYYLVYCLQWLDAFEGEKKCRIVNQWLPMHRAIILNLRPDKNYERIYYYIRILELLGLRQSDGTLEKIGEVLAKVRES